MAYEKQNFVDGAKLFSEQLEKMEDGIIEAQEAASVLTVTLTAIEGDERYLPSHSAAEIKEHLNNGGVALLVHNKKIYTPHNVAGSYAYFQYTSNPGGVKSIVYTAGVQDEYPGYDHPTVLLTSDICYKAAVSSAEVGQTLRVTAVNSDGVPTAWEAVDYQPRTHWTRVVEIVPETTVEVDAESGAAELPVVALEGGSDYTVKYNGTEYVCTCVDGIFLGNIGALGFIENMADTGEPFAVINEEALAIIPIDGSASITVSIVQKYVTPIPVEYMTNAFPYYVEVTTADDGTMTIAETADELNAIYNSGRQMIARVSERNDTNGYTLIVLYYTTWTFDYDDGSRAYMFARVPINTNSGVHGMIVINAVVDGTITITDNLD